MRWRILEKLVKENGWTQGAELGVFDGRTFTHLLKNCPELTLYGVDRFDSEFFRSTRDGRPPKSFNLESDEKRLRAWIKENCPERGFLLKMDTADSAWGFEDGEVDFVFVDADHRYEGVSRDIDAWMSKIKKGGMMLGHDYNKREFPGVVKAVEERFKDFTVHEDHVWSARLG